MSFWPSLILHLIVVFRQLHGQQVHTVAGIDFFLVCVLFGGHDSFFQKQAIVTRYKAWNCSGSFTNLQCRKGDLWWLRIFRISERFCSNSRLKFSGIFSKATTLLCIRVYVTCVDPKTVDIRINWRQWGDESTAWALSLLWTISALFGDRLNIRETNSAQP